MLGSVPDKVKALYPEVEEKHPRYAKLLTLAGLLPAMGEEADGAGTLTPLLLADATGLPLAEGMKAG